MTVSPTARRAVVLGGRQPFEKVQPRHSAGGRVARDAEPAADVRRHIPAGGGGGPVGAAVVPLALKSSMAWVQTALSKVQVKGPPPPACMMRCPPPPLTSEPAEQVPPRPHGLAAQAASVASHIATMPSNELPTSPSCSPQVLKKGRNTAAQALLQALGTLSALSVQSFGSSQQTKLTASDQIAIRSVVASHDVASGEAARPRRAARRAGGRRPKAARG